MFSAQRTVTAVAGAFLVLASAAQAQGPLSTGTFVSGRDQNWTVAVSAGPFVQAYEVGSNPGWGSFAGPTSARWISFSESSSGAGSPYTFQTTFDLTGYDESTAALSFQCGVDNSQGLILLNGVSASATCGGYGLGATQGFNSGFIAGLNTLEFVVGGDGQTDGFIFDTIAFSADITTTPEPASVVLFGSGLAMLAVFRRRRVK